MDFYNVDFDIAAVIIYIFVFACYMGKRHVKNSQYHSFLFLILFSFLTPLFDIPACFLREHQAAAFPVYLLTTFYYITKLCATCFFLLFIMSQMELNGKISRLKKVLIMLPLALVAIATIFNIWTGWLFTYDDRIWATGPLRSLNYFLNTLYLIWAFLYVSLNKDAVGKDFKILIQIIVVINILANCFQYVFEDLLIHSFASSVSLLVLNLNLEKYGVVLDSVSGMAKKEGFEKNVVKLLFHQNPFEVLFVRVKDYDMISNIFGVETVEEIFRKIEKYFIELAGAGNAFQVTNDTFVLVNYKDEYLAQNLNIIYSTLKRSWKVKGIDYSLEFFICHLKAYEHFNDWETLSGYLLYFSTMKKERAEIVPVNEMQIANPVFERKVERAMETGMRDGSFRVVYQPICTAKDKKFITAEALLRLTDPELGTISPDVFIPIAERSGLILRLGNFVLEQVCHFIAMHNIASLGLAYIELNLSTIQCIQEDFLKLIEETVSMYRISPRSLCFEITETASTSAPHIFADNLNELSKKGFRLALDDFGTGYANIQRMVTSDFEIIKFDKVLTQNFSNDKNLRDFYYTFISMLQSIGCKVVAEGVETKEQYEFIKNSGGDYIQGYYFSRPLSETDFVEFLKAHQDSPQEEDIPLL